MLDWQKEERHKVPKDERLPIPRSPERMRSGRLAPKF